MTVSPLIHHVSDRGGSTKAQKNLALRGGASAGVENGRSAPAGKGPELAEWMNDETKDQYVKGGVPPCA